MKKLFISAWVLSFLIIWIVSAYELTSSDYKTTDTITKKIETSISSKWDSYRSKYIDAVVKLKNNSNSERTKKIYDTVINNLNWTGANVVNTKNTQTWVTIVPNRKINTKTNKNNAMIKSNPTSNNTISLNCDDFSNKLNSCSSYACQFVHPFTWETLKKEIVGVVWWKCSYIEQMPNNWKMKCNYPMNSLAGIAQYYKDLTNKTAWTSIKIGNNQKEVTYTINGKVVNNPLQEELDNWDCVISGY